jgi:predicted ATPase
MAHITGLSLGNFKVFKEKMNFEFSPLTILTGGNNVGKSSVLKALLLIADNAKKTQFLDLDFSGDKHNLDTFDYTINKNADSDVMEIGFELSQSNEFRFSNYKTFKLSLSYKKNKNICNVKSYTVSRNNEELFSIRIDEKDKHQFYVNIREYQGGENDIDFVNEPLIDELLNNLPKIEKENFKKKIAKELVDYLSFLKINKSDWDYWHSINSFGEYSKPFENATYSDLINIFFKANIFSDEQGRLFKTIDNLPIIKTISESYKIDTNRIINDILSPSKSDIFYIFEDFLTDIHKPISSQVELDYISSFRANSKRLYSNQHQGTEFNELLLEIHKTKFSKETKQFIQDWLKAFGIGDDIHFTWFKGVATEVKIEKNGQLIDLVDLGFGITQLIPIILKIALIVEKRKYFHKAEDYLDRAIQKNKFVFNSDGSIRIKNLKNDYDTILEDDEQFKNKTYKRNELFDYHVVLLEEPETNLHPNFQSKLADFLLDASKRFNIQFIIETHSEYLIRKLQYLVATKETYPKDIALYYFNDPENIPQGEEQVKKIEFLEDGNLSENFGNGFFDEADNLAIDLFNLNRKKHRANV